MGQGKGFFLSDLHGPHGAGGSGPLGLALLRPMQADVFDFADEPKA